MMNGRDFNKRDYIVRISNADPLQLIIINYDLVLEHINIAKNQGDLNASKDAVTKAVRLLRQLMVSLDMSYDVAKELMSVYIYVNGLLVKSGVKLDSLNPSQASAYLEEAYGLMESLLEGWKALEEKGFSERSKRVFENSQQLYAGLTYKNGKLQEFIDEDKGRGYKA